MSRFETMTATEIRAHRETVMLRLLLRVTQIETAELVDRLHGLGHGAVQTAHIRLLGNIDTEGTRLVELARRTGNTRQAVSQMVTEIERRGYVERAPDPDDGRAMLVRHTADGRRLLVDALAEMADIEQGYADVIGESAMRDLKNALTTIAESSDPSSRLRPSSG